MINAYAAKGNDLIDARTVAPTKIGAMVNWLWVNTEYRPLAHWSDKFVTDRFNQIAPQDGVTIVEVVIHETKGLELEP